MQTKLERIAEISRYNPKAVFTSLYHLLNKELLMECHRVLDGKKAVGIDGVSKAGYEKNLEENMDSLVQSWFRLYRLATTLSYLSSLLINLLPRITSQML